MGSWGFRSQTSGTTLKSLLAEDDRTSRMVMEQFLEMYGTCRAVDTGQEALDAFKEAFESGEPFDLVCLDIMMPGLDGHSVLVKLREYEDEKGVGGLKGARVVMTTGLSDAKNVVQAFKEQCEAYLVKPITLDKLQEKLGDLKLI